MARDRYERRHRRAFRHRGIEPLSLEKRVAQLV
jgi:hypothetical protein